MYFACNRPSLTAGILSCAFLVTTVPVTGSPDQVDLREKPRKFEPLQARSELEEDRVLAAAEYSLGRIQFRRDQESQALRHFQRAYRYDPAAVSVLTEIVPLLVKLKHNDEAARYAVLAAEQSSPDPAMLRQLAILLTERMQFSRALNLFERSLEHGDGESPDATTALMHLEMGRLYYLTGQPEKSVQAFQLVRSALENPARFGLSEKLKQLLLGRAHVTYALMGESYLEAKQFDSAVELFAKADEANPNPPLLAYRLARVAAGREDFEEAIKQLQVYLDAKFSSAGARPYEFLAEWIRKLEADEATANSKIIDKLRDLYQDDPSNTALAYYYAAQCRKWELVDDARNAYSEALKIQPAVVGYRGLAGLLREQQEFEELLDLLAEGTSKVGDVDVFGDEVKALIGDKPLMQELYDRATNRTKQERDDVERPVDGLAMAIGLLAIKSKDFDTGDRFMELAIEAAVPETSEVIMAWGLTLIQEGQNEKAVEVFRRAVDEKIVTDESPLVHYYLSGALELAGRTDEAVQAARTAAEMRDDDPRFHARVAWILYHATRYEEATKSYQQLVDRFDEDHSSSAIRESLRDARFVLSNICVIEKDFIAAEEWLEQVLDEFPEDVGAMNDLGYLYADQAKRLQRALRMANLAVEAEPENRAYLDSLGWVMYQLERYDEALTYLEKAVNGDKPDGIILDHLGDVYLKLNKPEKAIEAWRRAVESFEENQNDELVRATQAKIDSRNPLE